MNGYDIVIRGGTVYDGSGSAPVTADIAIKEDKIAEIGNISARGEQELDASGAIVTPGFVDIHTHYDGLATWTSRMNPSSHHGVTTVVMGNCGVGFAPVRAEDHKMLVELMEGVEDIPGTALHEGLPWAWESFPDYLDYLDSREFDMDLGTQLPHAALRVYVMGQRGADREAATEEELKVMRKLTSEAIRAGALGFSSSRTLNHRSITGEPTPSLTAAEEELVAIGSGLADVGSGVLEMISDFKGLDHEFEILMAMVDAAKAPMSISLAQAGNNPQGWRKILGKIEEANARGRKVRAQVAPRGIGILTGLTGSRNLFTNTPTYLSIAELPLSERVEKMKNPETKNRILAELEEGDRAFTPLDRTFVVSPEFDYEPDPATSVSSLAQAKDVSPESLAYDLMLENDGNALLYRPINNYLENSLECCREMILHPHTVMGLGDGGAHVGFICDASFVTYLLCHWGRDRSRGERIPLETLIKAQTSDTAKAVGLNDRGVLGVGMKADVNVIDFDRLSIGLPRIVKDLPLNGPRFEQEATGIEATFVSGKPTYLHGEATDALPGRLIRGAKP